MRAFSGCGVDDCRVFGHHGRLAVHKNPVRIAAGRLQTGDGHNGRKIGLATVLSTGPNTFSWPSTCTRTSTLAGRRVRSQTAAPSGRERAEHRPAEMRDAGLGREPLNVRVGGQVGK